MAPATAPLAFIGCTGCGALQAAPEPVLNGPLTCTVCRSELTRTTGRSLGAAFACASATLLFLLPANLFPLLSTSILGATRQSHLISSVTAMWEGGWPWLALVIAALLVVAPLLRFGLLTAVLGALQLGRRPAWLGPAFRYANALEMWALTDVFLLAMWIAYVRLAALVSVTVEIGAVCFIIAGLLTLLTRATLCKEAVWDAIAPRGRQSRESAARAIVCSGCGWLAPEEDAGTPCPRCRKHLHGRRPNAVVFAAALTSAALVLYLPANLYPMATLPIGLKPSSYRVLEGVIDLVKAHLFGLGLLVFTASFAVPLLKLASLSLCVSSVLTGSRRRLVLKTRLYRIVEEIGRWSMVDPFVIACFVPVMHYNGLIYGQANAAATAFTGVVVLTMIATRCFDPRLMWDARLETR